jgi:hypothetical protein
MGLLNPESVSQRPGRSTLLLIAPSLFFMGAIFGADSAEPSSLRHEETAVFIMHGCRNSTEPASISDAFDQGLCLGLLKDLYYQRRDTCIPPVVTVGQLRASWSSTSMIARRACTKISEYLLLRP